jgi:phosphoenolpyruvate carboxylase
MLFVKTTIKYKELLAQLGKTPFIQNEKPNPFDEAVSLIWYLENVFYRTLIWFIICKKPFQSRVIKNAIINLVFA